VRIAILLDSDRQVGAQAALADALCRRGHAVHLSVQGDTVKDREGALARLGAAHQRLTVGHAPRPGGRFAGLLHDLLNRLEPLGEADEGDGPHGADGGLLLGLVAAGLAADPDVEAYLSQLDLDLMLAPPRTDAWSGRIDYLAACRRLGVRTALLASPVAEAPSRLAAAFGARAIACAEGAGSAEALADAIEAAAGAPAPPRPAAMPATAALELVLARRALRRLAEDRLGADVSRGALIGLVRRSGGAVKDLYARWIFPRLMRGLLALLPRRRAFYRDMLREQLDPGETVRLGFVEDAIADARRGRAPIMIGPWTGGVGHEILCWIPMLRWFRKAYNIDKSRIVVISRGGTKDWYTGILGGYLDMFDLVPLKRQEYRDDAMRRIDSTEAPPSAGKIEKELYNEAARLIGAERYNVLHPQVMFKLFKRRWTGVAGDTFLARYTRQQPIGASRYAAEKRLGSLPHDYVALDFRFGPAVPDTPANREAITRFVLQLSQHSDVFLIEPVIDAQAGPMAGIGPDPRIHRIDREVRPSEILAVQSAIIAGSRALVGTFGPMSCLGQALGRTTIGVKAQDGVIDPGLEELAMVPPDPEAGPLHVVGLESLDQLVPGLSARGAPALDGVLAAVALAPPPSRARRLTGVAER
jgi:hypothetical protein